MRTNGENPIQILLLEDQPLIAADIASVLEERGYGVIGPARTCLDALVLIESHDVDAAILDYIIGDENCEPVAEALDSRGIPWALTTGIDAQALPSRLREMPLITKPYRESDLVRAVADLTEAKAA